MDVVYRAMDGGSGRVALSDAARRRKDRDAARRARRKGYAAGLTSTLVDAYWREATESVGNRRVAPPNAPVTMSGEQAVAFFSRSGLPNGEEPRSRAARAAPGPRPAALYPKPRRVCFSGAFFFANDARSDDATPLKKNITADVLATVWELAKSGRKGDPHGLTKPEFERAACLVSFGIHEHVASLKPRSASNGAPPPNGTAAERKIAKRLGYARAGMFWKFEAFDVAPKEAPLVHGVSRSDARRSSTELSNTGQRVENAQNGGPNDGRLVSPTLSAARPLVAPITLDVPVSTRKESQSKKSAKSARASGDAGDAEDAFFFSASDDEARADHSASTWDARFPEDPAEDPTTKKKAAREPETAKTPSAPSSDPSDPFADLVAAISADPSPPPRRDASASIAPKEDERSRRGSSRGSSAPHLLDEFPGAPSVSLDLTRLGLADSSNGPAKDPEDPATGRESARRSPRASPETTPTLTPTFPPRSASPAFDPAFETLRGSEAFAFDFSGRAFGATADASADLKSASQGVEKDDVAIASRARVRDETDETEETDETFGVEDPEPDPEDAPLFFGSEDFSGGFLDDDGGVDPPASTSDAPRPARDPEMEEWSAACRAWPWLADEARTEERRDQKQAEAEAGWAAF